VTRRGAAHQLAAVDRAVYDAIAATPTPALDGPLRRLSRAADKSRIWLALAGLLAVAGGPAGRRAAVRGTLALGASAFAFATAISRDRPWVALGAGFLAAAVAYSRVHTGVHYPGDTVIGSLIGASTGLAVADLLDHRALAGPARAGGLSQH
jgi:hypothetical protein